MDRERERDKKALLFPDPIPRLGFVLELLSQKLIATQKDLNLI